MTSELRRVRTRFADDNPLLYLSLGLLSSFQSIDRILEKHAALGPNQRDDTNSDAAANDQHGIDFILGLIALRTRIEKQLEGVATSAAKTGAAAVATKNSKEESRESLLR